MKKFNFVIVFVFLLVLVFLTIENFRIHVPANIKMVKVAGASIVVNLAQTNEMRIQGLSGQESLEEGEGMLFVFDIVGKYPFWMKDMNFPIDIIWLAPLQNGDEGDAEVIYLKEDARPELFPEIYMPDEEAKYVLEVVSGFSKKNNLKVGDRVEFIY